MELELSLGGDASSKPFAFRQASISDRGLAFSMGLGLCSVGNGREEDKIHGDDDGLARDQTPATALHLLPLLPASHQSLPWPSDNGNHIPNHKIPTGFF